MNSSITNFFESIIYGIARFINGVVNISADVLTLSS